MVIPASMNLAPYETYYAFFICEGVEASSGAGDVTIYGVFTENATGRQISSDASLTVVQVEVKPRVVAPRNDRPYRHSYGVCELVQHLQSPSAPAVIWNPIGGGSNEVLAGESHYRCPLGGCENPLRAEIGIVRYTPKIKVVEPQGVRSKALDPLVYSNAVHIGEAGGIGMKLYLYVEPFDVSFSQIAVEEVPCMTYEATGYFTNPYYNGAFGHTRQAGAGNWVNVDLNNRMNCEDEAAYRDSIPWLTPNGMVTTNVAYAWADGRVYIDHPFGWNAKGTAGETPPYKEFGTDIKATIMLDAQGRVGLWKLDNWIERLTNGVYRMYGPRGKREE